MISSRRTSTLLRLFARYLAPRRGWVVLMIFIMICNAGAQLALPSLIASFIDGAAARLPAGVMGGIALTFLVVALVSQVTAALGKYLATDLGMRATNALRSDVLSHVLAQDIGWHNATTPGALIERIDGDASRLNTFLSNMLPNLLVNSLLLAGTLGALFWIDWRAGALGVAYLPTAWLVVRVIRPHSTRLFNHEREQSARLFGFIEEHLAGTEDVRANGAVDHVMRRFFTASRPWAAAMARAQIVGSLSWLSPAMLYSFVLAAMLALGVWLIGAGAITLGSLVALYRYTFLLSQPLNDIGRQVMELFEASASAARLDELLAQTPALSENGTRTLPSGALALNVEHVSFAYADAQNNVLRDISLGLTPRRVLGLLGRTGSGKTTLTRLIARLYDVSAGEIRLNGQNIAGVAAANLRQRVTVVTQEVQVFSASARDNITLFDKDIDDARIWSALDRVGLRGWAEALPRGLETELAAGGSGLSAGQAQLLAFARAFLRDPGLVILDEASSRLDPATELQLERAIDALLQGRTAIVIAHRLKTVQRASDILVLEDGAIAEYGERAALAADPSSRYYALLNFGAEEVLA